MAKLHIKEPHATLVVIFLAAATFVLCRFWSRDTNPPRESWFAWLIIALGAGGILGGILDRAMKPNLKRIGRSDAVMILLGPTGSRILFAVLGGAFLGGGISLLLAH